MSQNADFKGAATCGFIGVLVFSYWLAPKLMFLRGSVMEQIQKPIEPGSMLPIWGAAGVFLGFLFLAVSLVIYRVLQRVGLRQTGRKLEFTQRELRDGMPGAQLLKRRT